jgi:hypothetical protein
VNNGNNRWERDNKKEGEEKGLLELVNKKFLIKSKYNVYVHSKPW